MSADNRQTRSDRRANDRRMGDRRRHERRGLLIPPDFIGLGEDNGLTQVNPQGQAFDPEQGRRVCAHSVGVIRTPATAPTLMERGAPLR